MSSAFKQWVKSAGMTPQPCIKFQTLKSVLNTFIVDIASHKKLVNGSPSCSEIACFELLTYTS